jgi:hypothetical protein
MMMMGKQHRLTTTNHPGGGRNNNIDADIGVLDYGGTHTQYLYRPNQESRQVQEEEDDEGSVNITTTAFDYVYYVFCTYYNCTCTDVDWTEQTMSAACDKMGNSCYNAIYACLAEKNGNRTDSCDYEVRQTLTITGPETFENSFCKTRSSPYYEKTCWYYGGVNVTYSDKDGLNYDIYECAMSFNGEMCNACTPSPTTFEYCYPNDGNCTNYTMPCNEFDCTNTAQGTLIPLFFLNVLYILSYVLFIYFLLASHTTNW